MQSRHPIAASLALACVLSACATSSQSTAPGTGETAFEGTIVSVDTSPWAYDGNAVIVVATRDAGTRQVQLPARWNLCKAEAPADVQSLAPDDRVHVAGAVDDSGAVVVCAQPGHHLRKAD